MKTQEDEFIELVNEYVAKVEIEGGNGKHIVDLVNDLNTLAGGTKPIIAYEEPYMTTDPDTTTIVLRADEVIAEEWTQADGDPDKMEDLLVELLEELLENRQDLLDRLSEMQAYLDLDDFNEEDVI